MYDDQEKFLNQNRIFLKNYKGFDVFHRTHCPDCGKNKRDNLSVLITRKGGVYANCHRCNKEWKKPSKGTFTNDHSTIRGSRDRFRNGGKVRLGVDKRAWWV